MKFTNRFNFPSYLADWLRADSYDYILDPYTLSATTLLKPIRSYWLSVRHGEELEMDVSDILSARYGSAIHDSVEKIQSANVLKEQRVAKKINIRDQEYIVSGKYDILEDDDEDGIWTLRDMKTTSVWAYIFGGHDKDYRTQLSIYRWLLFGAKSINDTAYIDFFFTDWQSSKAKYEDNYPPRKIMPGYPIKLLSVEDTGSYIINRIAEFEKYRNVEDDKLPLCTKEELWASADTFAIQKPGLKKATKVCSTEAEAQTYIKDNGIKNADIECRPGKVKKCKYCPGLPFCCQGQKYLKDNLIDL